MAAKDFFKELDPLIEWREEEMSLMEKVRSESWERKGKEPPHGYGLLILGHLVIAISGSMESSSLTAQSLNNILEIIVFNGIFNLHQVTVEHLAC